MIFRFQPEFDFNLNKKNFFLNGLFRCIKNEMKKVFRLLLIAIMLMNLQNSFSQLIYDYKVKDINGADFDFSDLKGKKIMIVNTASKCGLTPQYEKLEKVYQKYKSKNFVIIGFPSNDFLSQEPGTNAEIATFCKKNYGVTFPMMSKIKVKGKNMHSIYQFLTRKELNKYSDNEVKWNFQKYLIDTNGKLVKVVDPQTSPDDPEIIRWITD